MFLLCHVQPKGKMQRNQTIGFPRIKTSGNFMYPPNVTEGALRHVIRGQCNVYKFPYHCYKVRQQDCLSILETVPRNETRSNSDSVSPRIGHLSKLFSMFNKLNVFPKVYASDAQSHNDDSLVRGSDIQTINTADSESEGSSQSTTMTMEALARAYIAQETGMDRVRMLFQKDHKGDSSPQMLYYKASVVSIGLISFLINYVPAYKLAKQEFIRQHNATAFRTTIEAVRKMSDQASFEAILVGGRFAIKITTFCATFLLISQVLASYRNKTSTSDSTIAAGITGGLARLQMGPKGFVSGSVVGMALGTVFGVIASCLQHLCGATEDAQHLEAVMSRLEVERSISGDSVFKQKMKELTERATAVPTSSW